MVPDLIQLVLHIDQNLPALIQDYGFWIYLILFGIIFFETGFVITPYLPGDSLLFVAGICAAGGLVNLPWLIVAFIAGAIAGDTANYWIGHYCGSTLFRSRFCRIFRDEHYMKTRHFFERYGGKTIFIARFLPMIRTFAPFLAGVGTMHYRKFIFYNITGAFAWTFSIVLAGYYLGAIPVVQTNLNLLVYCVVALTIATVIFILYNIIRILRSKQGSRERLLP